MRKRALVAAALALALLAASGCGSDAPKDPWIVTSTHHYPAHTNVTYAGNCPANANDGAPLPTDCTKHQVEYPELWEVCAKKSDGIEKCWYVPHDFDWVQQEQKVGTAVRDKESYTFIDEHPKPTNEWDGQR